MVSKAISLFAVLTLLFISTFCQNNRYFKNFDFYTMNGVDSLTNINSLPDFYVKCIYDNSDNLIGISATSKISFNYLHSTTHFGIIKKNDKSFLLFGSGKQRDGYTRALFQRKIFISDSAMIINDTMLYKQTSEKYIRIQYFTGINRDSISFSEVYIPFVKKKDMKASKFSSFNFYKDWFIIDSSASQIVSGMINLRSDTILIRNKIKSNYFINPLNITQESLQNLPGMPITFFWLKDSGLLN